MNGAHILWAFNCAKSNSWDPPHHDNFLPHSKQRVQWLCLYNFLKFLLCDLTCDAPHARLNIKHQIPSRQFSQQPAYHSSCSLPSWYVAMLPLPLYRSKHTCSQSRLPYHRLYLNVWTLSMTSWRSVHAAKDKTGMQTGTWWGWSQGIGFAHKM